MLKPPSCVSCVNRCGQTVGFGVSGECKSWSALFTAAMKFSKSSPCPLLFTVLRSTAFLAVLQCSLLFLHCSSATCSLWASPCCLERLAFLWLPGAVAEFFPPCGRERPAPAGRVGQSLLLSATRAFEGRAAALSMKCCCVYSPVS